MAAEQDGKPSDEASPALGVKEPSDPADDRDMLIASTGGGVLVGLLLLLCLYFLPTIVAKVRNVPNFGSVLVINLFLGFTFIGWVVALAMAARSVPRRAVY